MKDLCKKIYAWTVKLFQSVVSLISVQLFSSRKIAKSILRLSSQEKGNSCVILGNGPSLKGVLEQDLYFFKSYDCVAVNTFCNNEAFFVLHPKYYVLTDPAFFNDHVVDKRVLDIQEQVVNGLGKVDWEMVLFLPSINSDSKMIQQFKNTHIRFSFYNLTPIDGFLPLQHWLFKKNLGMPIAMNVLCASTFLMINLGYKDIYLLGADHSWLESFYVNDNNEVILGDRHFYGEQAVKCPSTLSQWLYNVATGFRTHERISEYAEYMGVHVYNATKGSYVDAYPRKDLPVSR